MSSTKCSSLPPSEAWNFIFELPGSNSPSLQLFLSALWCSLGNLGHSLMGLAIDVAALTYYLLIGIVKLGTGAAPHIFWFFTQVYQFHKEQLSFVDILFECTLLVLLIIVYFRSAEISKYIQKLEKNLANKSRLAKTKTNRLLGVAPHFVFFFVIVVSAFAGRKFLAPLATPAVLPMFSLVIPVLTTSWMCLRSVSSEQSLSVLSNSELRDIAREGRSKILLWIALTVYHSVVTTISLIPFSQFFIHPYLPFLRGMAFLVCIFTQLSPIFGEIVFEVSSPILSRCAERIPSSTSEEERGMKVLNVLVSLGWLQESTASLFRSLFVEGTTLAILIIFSLMPSRLATLGVVLIALILPGIRASTVITSWDESDEGFNGFGPGSVRRTWTGRSEPSSAEPRSLSSSLLAALRTLSPMKERTPAPTPVAALASDAKEADQADSPEAQESPHNGGDGSSTTRSTVRFDENATTVQAAEPGTSECDVDADEQGQPEQCLGAFHSDNGTEEEPSEADGAYDVSFNVGAFSSGRKVRRSVTETCHLITRQQRWLKYFVCLGSLWALRCAGIVFWPSITMLVAWWLSHSIWAGAHRLSKYIVQLVEFVPEMLTPALLIRLVRGLFSFLQGQLISGKGDMGGSVDFTPEHRSLSPEDRDDAEATPPSTNMTSKSSIGWDSVRSPEATPLVPSSTSSTTRRRYSSRNRTRSTSSLSNNSSEAAESPSDSSRSRTRNGSRSSKK